jgi:hypothetical protein
MNYRIPANLNLDKLIEEHPPRFEPFSKDMVAATITCIYNAYSSNWTVYDGYYQIHSDTLLRFVGIDYLRYVNYLIECGVIQRDNSYRPKSKVNIPDFSPVEEPKSIGYKLTDKYEDSIAVKYVHPLNGRRVSGKIKKFDSKQISLRLKEYPFLQHLNGLRMDVGAAETLLLKLKMEAENMSGITEELRHKVSMKVNANNQLLDVIASGDLLRHSNEDKTGKRMHTPLTRLKRELRKYITHKEEHLVALDLKNSQPYLSLALFELDFWVEPINPVVNFSTKEGKRIKAHPLTGGMFRDSEQIRKKIHQYLNIGNLYPEFASRIWKITEAPSGVATSSKTSTDTSGTGAIPVSSATAPGAPSVQVSSSDFSM